MHGRWQAGMGADSAGTGNTLGLATNEENLCAQIQ